MSGWGDRSISPASLVKIFKDVEGACDTSGAMFGDFHLWPLIRRIVYFANHEKTPIDQSGHLDIFDAALKKSAATLAFRSTGQDSIAYDKQLRRLQGEAALDVLFQVNRDSYVELSGDLSVTPLVDPVADAVADKYATAKLETGKQNAKGRESVIPGVYFEVPSIAAHLMDAETAQSFTGLDNVIACLQTAIERQFDRAVLWQEIVTLIRHRIAFEALLKQSKPRLVVTSIYYALPHMALLWACRNLSVPSVELQHGVMAPNHPLYAGFTDVPPDGYHGTPDHTFVWDQYTAGDIAACKPKNRRQQTAHVTGHPYVSHWKSLNSSALSVGIASLQERAATYEKVVLYTLQATRDPFPEPVLQAMKARPEWLWLARCHPKNRSRLADYRDFLARHGCAHVELDVSTAAPFYALLQLTDVMIAKYSSTFLEALNFSVPCIAMPCPENEYFQDLLEKGLITQASTAEDVVSLVTRSDSLKRLASGDDRLMPTEISQFENAVGSLLDNTPSPWDKAS